MTKITAMVRAVTRMSMKGTAVVQQSAMVPMDDNTSPEVKEFNSDDVYAEWVAVSPAGMRYFVKVDGVEFVIRASENRSLVRQLSKLFLLPKHGKMMRFSYAVVLPVNRK